MLKALRCKPCCIREIWRTLTSLAFRADQQREWMDTSSVTTEMKG
jgi:hypothetical protein